MTAECPWLAETSGGDKRANCDYVYFDIDYWLPVRCLLRDVGDSPTPWLTWRYAWMSVCEQTGEIRPHFYSGDGCRHLDDPGATFAVFRVGCAIFFAPRLIDVLLSRLALAGDLSR